MSCTVISGLKKWSTHQSRNQNSVDELVTANLGICENSCWSITFLMSKCSSICFMYMTSWLKSVFFQEIKVEAIIDVLSSWSLGSIIIKNQITASWIFRNQQEIHLTSVSSSHVFIIMFLNQSLFHSPTQLLSYLLKRIVVFKKSIHQKP